MKKLAQIQRYLPKDLTQRVLAQKDKIEGERKQVTVMFCDMEGFTQLTEKLGSEQMYSIMDEVYEILIHKVHDYEGTVNELTYSVQFLGCIPRCTGATVYAELDAPRENKVPMSLLGWTHLRAEKGFRRVKGYLEIPKVIATIEQIPEEHVL